MMSVAKRFFCDKFGRNSKPCGMNKFFIDASHQERCKVSVQPNHVVVTYEKSWRQKWRFTRKSGKLSDRDYIGDDNDRFGLCNWWADYSLGMASDYRRIGWRCIRLQETVIAGFGPHERPLCLPSNVHEKPNRSQWPNNYKLAKPNSYTLVKKSLRSRHWGSSQLSKY